MTQFLIEEALLERKHWLERASQTGGDETGAVMSTAPVASPHERAGSAHAEAMARARGEM